MHTLRGADDLEHWGLEPRVMTKAYCFIEVLIRRREFLSLLQNSAFPVSNSWILRLACLDVELM